MYCYIDCTSQRFLESTADRRNMNIVKIVNYVRRKEENNKINRKFVTPQNMIIVSGMWVIFVNDQCCHEYPRVGI